MVLVCHVPLTPQAFPFNNWQLFQPLRASACPWPSRSALQEVPLNVQTFAVAESIATGL